MLTHNRQTWSRMLRPAAKHLLAPLLVLCALSALSQNYPTQTRELPPVTITEERARDLMRQLTDLDAFMHSVGIENIAKDERLEAYATGFAERNHIEVFTIGYIDSDELWPRVFRNIRLKKLNNAATDQLLAAHILFIPQTEGYTVELKLEGKTTEVYELLELTEEEVTLIAKETSAQQLGSTTYAKPKEARETVVNALIAALERVEGNSRVDNNGDDWVVDKEGNVTQGGSGGGNIPDGGTETDSVLFVQKELIKEVLEHYKEEINLWLENNGKGPLEAALIRRLMAMPDCLPEDDEGLEAVLERLEYFEENPEELIELITANTENQDRFDFLINKLNGEQPAYREGLTETEWDELLTMVCPHLLPEENEEETDTSGLVYDYFIANDDAWLRKTDDPGTFITPTEKATLGTQVALLEELEAGGKDVAKLKIKSSGDTIFITNRSDYLIQVESLSKELKYKMKKDYTATKLPYASDKSDKTYKKDSTFTAYEKCGNYVKVKGEGNDEIEGHWISKDAAVATEAEFEVKTEDLEDVFTSADKETLKTVVETLNDYSNSFGLTNEDRMANFLAQTGYESNSFKGRSGESGCYTSTNTNGWKIWFNLTWKEKPFSSSYDNTLNTQKRYSKKLKWTALKCDSTDTDCVKVPDDYVCTSKGADHDKKFFSYVYQAEGGNGDSKSEDGYKYRGHGAIQLTWKKTYEAFQKWLNSNYKGDKTPDVVKDPTILDTNKEIFLLSALWFWQENGLNKHVDNDDFDKVTSVINSAKEGKVKRKKILDKLKETL